MSQKGKWGEWIDGAILEGGGESESTNLHWLTLAPEKTWKAGKVGLCFRQDTSKQKNPPNKVFRRV